MLKQMFLTADSNNQSAQNVLENTQDQLKTAQEAQAKKLKQIMMLLMKIMLSLHKMM